MVMTNEYFVNDLSIHKQFVNDTVRQFEREVAILQDIRALLAEHRLLFHLNRKILSRLLHTNVSVENAIELIERGLAAYFWEWIISWPHHETVEQEFGVRVFHKAIDATDSGAAHPAVHVWLANARITKNLFSSASSDVFALDSLDFKVIEGKETHLVSLRNFRTKEQIRQEIGVPISVPKDWKGAIARLAEKFVYVILTEDVKKKLALIPFNANFYDSVEEKLARLDEIVGVAVNLNALRNDANSEGNQDKIEGLTTRYNELYQNMFAHENSSFSDESQTRKDQLKDKFKFHIPGRDDKISCHFHIKFDYRTSRLHFTWPIEKQDSCSYVAYLGRKIL